MSEDLFSLSKEELINRIRELDRDLIHDPLTGLKSRKYFADSLKAYLKLAFGGMPNAERMALRALDRERFGVLSTSVLFCDIDHFKGINDTYGHKAGDGVLVSVADALRVWVRTSDIVARWGGEEIVIALLGMPEERCAEKAERLRKVVKHLAFPEYPDLNVTISIGVSSTDSMPEERTGNIDAVFDALMRRADSALYVAKEGGRNQTVLWRVGMDEKKGNQTRKLER